MRKTYRKRPGFSDDLERAGEGIFLRLTKNQVEVLEKLARAAGKSLKEYLRDIGEAIIQHVIPAKKE
jgi:hypothetical protein